MGVVATSARGYYKSAQTSWRSAIVKYIEREAFKPPTPNSRRFIKTRTLQSSDVKTSAAVHLPLLADMPVLLPPAALIEENGNFRFATMPASSTSLSTSSTTLITTTTNAHFAVVDLQEKKLPGKHQRLHRFTLQFGENWFHAYQHYHKDTPEDRRFSYLLLSKLPQSANAVRCRQLFFYLHANADAVEMGPVAVWKRLLSRYYETEIAKRDMELDHLVFVAPEYPGYETEFLGKTVPTIRQTEEAVLAVLRSVLLKYTNFELILIGRSLGCCFALTLANWLQEYRPDVHFKLVLTCPFENLRTYVGEKTWSATVIPPDILNNGNAIVNLRASVPVLFIHGCNDTDVSINQSKSLYRLLLHERTRLLNDVLNPAAVHSALHSIKYDWQQEKTHNSCDEICDRSISFFKTA